jgi:4-hydroxybenzoate polyprenyltransferase
LLGYLKDVGADRATGYETVAVRFGRKPAVVLSAAHWLAGAACSALLLSETTSITDLGAMLALAGALLIGAAHVRIWPKTRDDEAHPSLVWVVVGYVALHFGEAVAFRPALALPSIALLGLLGLALRARPERSQL